MWGPLVVNNWIKAVSYLQISDKRLKTNIKDITDALKIVSKLKGRTYQWIDENQLGNGGPMVIGLIAQEVQAVLPEVVHEDPITGYLSVSYIEIIPVLIDAFNHFVLEMTEFQKSNERELTQLRMNIHRISDEIIRQCTEILLTKL